MTDPRNPNDETATRNHNLPMPEPVLNSEQDPDSVKDPLKEEQRKSERLERNGGKASEDDNRQGG